MNAAEWAKFVAAHQPERFNSGSLYRGFDARIDDSSGRVWVRAYAPRVSAEHILTLEEVERLRDWLNKYYPKSSPKES